MRVLKLVFSECVFDTDYPAGASGKHPQVRGAQNPVLLVKKLLRKFRSLGGSVLKFCMGTRSIAKACQLAAKHYKFRRYTVSKVE